MIEGYCVEEPMHVQLTVWHKRFVFILDIVKRIFIHRDHKILKYYVSSLFRLYIRHEMFFSSRQDSDVSIDI